MGTNWEKILGNAGIQISGIDIGCSSGRPYQWELLGSALKYVGVDPLISEVERLRELKEKNSTYTDAFLDFPAAKGHADTETSDLFIRTSAYSFSHKKFDARKEIYNAGKSVLITENRILIGDLLADNKIVDLDLLKIDIDGDDFLCMREFGRLGLLESLMSLQIESQFHGENTDLGNTLWNIGKLANKNELHLFDLSINRYSRKDLPSRFLYSFPAQTIHGQAMWGDSLFIKDSKRSELTDIELVKLVAIYEIHEFYDCALEVIDTNFTQLSDLIPIEDIKNSLISNHKKRERRPQTRGKGIFWLKKSLKKLMG